MVMLLNMIGRSGGWIRSGAVGPVSGRHSEVRRESGRGLIIGHCGDTAQRMHGEIRWRDRADQGTGSGGGAQRLREERRVSFFGRVTGVEREESETAISSKICGELDVCRNGEIMNKKL